MSGYGLVALIFAREVSDPLISLVKAIDSQLEGSALPRRGREKPGVHVIFCSDDAGLKPRLDALIVKEGIKHVVFSISREKAQGPLRYRVAREAELTLVIFKDQETVVANHVLDSLDLTPDRGEQILKSVKNVLP